jgi:hypothetical protein
MTVRRLRGGLDDGTCSGEVDDDVSENCRGLGFAKSTQ